jgi:hypothetical protein
MRAKRLYIDYVVVELFTVEVGVLHPSVISSWCGASGVGVILPTAWHAAHTTLASLAYFCGDPTGNVRVLTLEESRYAP